jgi:hypothetical protein
MWSRPPEWRSGLRHRAVLQPAVTGRPMRQGTIGPALSRLGEGLAGRDVFVPSRFSDSCGGPGTCTLTRLPVVQCFLRHVVAAGFRLKRAVCQKAGWLGRVVFRRMRGSRPSPLPSWELKWWDETGTTNSISQKRGKKYHKKMWRSCVYL